MTVRCPMFVNGRAKGQSQMRNSLFYKVFCRRTVKKFLERIPFVRRIYSGWNKVHPFDVHYGTDTSGYVPVEKLTTDAALRKQINSFASSQPTIARKAFASIPNPHEYSFIDFGCGKGRVAVIASEYSFKQIIGLELSSDLARVAQANGGIVKTRFPDRAPIKIVECNALKYSLPSGKLVIYLCHSFNRELLAELINLLESGLVSETIEHLFFIYYNPVHGDMFDALPTMSRWFAEVVPYDETEIGYGPDLEDTVVVWQSVRGAYPKPHTGASRRIVIHKAMWTAGLETAVSR